MQHFSHSAAPSHTAPLKTLFGVFTSLSGPQSLQCHATSLSSWSLHLACTHSAASFLLPSFLVGDALYRWNSSHLPLPVDTQILFFCLQYILLLHSFLTALPHTPILLHTRVPGLHSYTFYRHYTRLSHTSYVPHLTPAPHYLCGCLHTASIPRGGLLPPLTWVSPLSAGYLPLPCRTLPHATTTRTARAYCWMPLHLLLFSSPSLCTAPGPLFALSFKTHCTASRLCTHLSYTFLSQVPFATHLHTTQLITLRVLSHLSPHTSLPCIATPHHCHALIYGLSSPHCHLHLHYCTFSLSFVAAVSFASDVHAAGPSLFCAPRSRTWTHLSCLHPLSTLFKHFLSYAAHSIYSLAHAMHYLSAVSGGTLITAHSLRGSGSCRFSSFWKDTPLSALSSRLTLGAHPFARIYIFNTQDACALSLCRVRLLCLSHGTLLRALHC